MTAPVSSEARGSTRTTLIGVAFALTAAVAYGTAQVLTRHATSDLAPPLVGACLALAWGTLGFAAISARSLGRVEGNARRGALYFVGAGLFSATGVMLMFQALSRGKVIVLSPILATNPLFTLLFAAALLRGVERITVRSAIGALLVVAGVVVLSVT